MARCVVSNASVSRTLALIAGTVVLAITVVALISRPHFSRSSVQVFGASCPCLTFHEEVTGFIVLNPLRDPEPERVASQFLSDVRHGKCIVDERSVPGLCHAALERRIVLDSKLRNRKDTGNIVELFYVFRGKFRPDRDTNPEEWGEGMVQVERVANEWNVTNYGSRY
jgi:hypothetical protein